MSRLSQKTGSLVLTSLALTLAFVFSVWCAVTATSVQRLRQQQAADLEVLGAVEELRLSVSRLDEIAMASGAEADPAEWDRVMARARDVLAGIDSAAPLSEVTQAELEALTSVLDQVDDAGRALLGGRAAVHRAYLPVHRSIHHQMTASAQQVRAQVGLSSTRIDRRWNWLNGLAMLSIGSVVLLALLLHRARVDAARYRQSQEQARRSRELLRSLLSAVPDLIMVLDREGTHRHVYTAHPEVLLRPAEELLGLSIHDVMPAEPAAMMQRVIDDVLASERMCTLEYAMKIGDRDFWFSARVVPFGEPGDRCVLWIARDVTHEHEGTRRLADSEERFRLMAENIDAVIVLAPADFHEFEYISPAYETIWGRSCQSLYDDPFSWQESIHPDDVDRVAGAFRRALETKEPYEQQYRIIRGDGEVRWVSGRTIPIRGADGEIRRVAGVAVDISEHKAAEQAIREREQRLGSIINTASDAVIVADGAGRITLWNRASAQIFGYEAEEIIGRPLDILVPPHLREAHAAGLRRTAKGGGQPRSAVKTTGLHKDGREFPIELSMTGWHTDDAVFFTGIVRDVTDRERAEAALRTSEQMFRSAFEDTAVGMAVCSAAGCVLEANQAFCRQFGYEEQELRGMSFRELTHPDDLADSERQLRELLAGRSRSFTIDKRYRRRDGSVVWAQTSVALVRSDAGEPVHAVVETQDITAQKRAQEQLRASNERLELRVRERTGELEQQVVERERAERIQAGRGVVLERLSSGAPLTEVLTLLVRSIEEIYPAFRASMLLVDESGRRLRRGAAPSLPESFNQAVDGLRVAVGNGSCGTAAATGERFIADDVETHPACAAYRELARQTNIRSTCSEPILSSGGEVLGTVAVYGSEPGTPDDACLAFIRSAAQLASIAIEQRRSQEQLRVSDRLASIGTLAAGLGHDMNNVLFPLRCRFDVLDWDTVPPALREVLESSRDSVSFLHQLATGLRLMAADPERRQETAASTSLPAWWGQVEPLIRRMLRQDCRLTVDFGRELPEVAAAPHVLTQALMNLVVNASEAMPNGGVVRLWARPARRADRVVIGVSDQGSGMTEEVKRRALDPFFTTKQRSLSTGLGLSLVRGLVRNCGGTVEIDSQPGAGTTIRLTLPAAPACAAEAASNGECGRAAVSLTDLHASAWVSGVLASAGYRVTHARDGDPCDNELWVTDPSGDRLDAARAWLAGDPRRRIILLGRVDNGWGDLEAVSIVEDARNLKAIEAAVRRVSGVRP